MFGAPFKLVLVLLAIGVLLFVAIAFYGHGYQQAVDEYQPKLNAANARIGALTVADQINQHTIASLQENERAKDELLDQQATRVATLEQQQGDTAAAIRKLQENDHTVESYLRTPIPSALRRLLEGGPGLEPAAAGSGD